MNKIWALLGVVGAAVLAIFTAYSKGGKAKEDEIVAKTEKTARKYEKASSDALSDGLQKEAKVSNEKPDTDIVNHFK